MEIKEVQRVAITKPVASKPSLSKFKSFSELLAGAINASPSPPNICAETAMPAIRPKTVRVKPIVNRASIAVLSSQGEASGTSQASKLPEFKSSVIYKPLAKVVSKATVSLLASMGSPSIITHQQVLAQIEARAQHLNQGKLHLTNKPISYPAMDIIPAQADQKVKKTTSEGKEEEQKPFTASANVDRPSYDGYNWRKYGQKQVKGSKYPRSYYKCTHPDCPVKKKVERSPDGQIAEIVYKGEHNHPKPLPPKKSSSGAQGNDQDTKTSKSSNNNISELNEGSEGHAENHGEVVVVLPSQSTYLKRSAQVSHSAADCDDGSKGLEAEEDEPRNKRWKSVNQYNETGSLVEGIIQEPRVSVQNATETAILGDGFRWRKYGQKVVKGNAYPRSYYKCTSVKCNVRKHVERASEDPNAFITTYEGKHNHDMPLRVTNSPASH